MSMFMSSSSLRPPIIDSLCSQPYLFTPDQLPVACHVYVHPNYRDLPVAQLCSLLFLRHFL